MGKTAKNQWRIMRGEVYRWIDGNQNGQSTGRGGGLSLTVLAFVLDVVLEPAQGLQETLTGRAEEHEAFPGDGAIALGE